MNHIAYIQGAYNRQVELAFDLSWPKRKGIGRQRCILVYVYLVQKLSLLRVCSREFAIAGTERRYLGVIDCSTKSA